MTCALMLAVLFGHRHREGLAHPASRSSSAARRPFGGPAYQAILPDDGGERTKCRTPSRMNSIQFNLARVIGPGTRGGRIAHDRRRILVLRSERPVVPCRDPFAVHDSRRLFSGEVRRLRAHQHERRASASSRIRARHGWSLIVLAFCMTRPGHSAADLPAGLRQGCAHGDASAFSNLCVFRRGPYAAACCGFAGRATSG